MSAIDLSAPIGTPVGEEPAPQAPTNCLNLITSGRTKVPRRIMLYGEHGIGKSTFAAGAPSPIFVPTEEGTHHLDVARFPVAKTMTDFRSYVGTLLRESHEYKTVVIDTVDWLERLVMREVCEAAGVSAIGDIPYGQGWSRVGAMMEQLLHNLSRFRDREITVLLLAHARVGRVELPNQEPYHRYTLDLHDKQIAPAVQEWCDDVLFANWEVFVTKDKGDFGKERPVATGGQRVLYTTTRVESAGKTRIAGIPEKLPLSWDAFAKYL